MAHHQNIMFTLETHCIIIIQDIIRGSGGILSSTGFKIDGDADTIYFLDDDGKGNVRRYSLSGSTRTYANNTQVQLIIQQVQLQLIL